MKMLRVMLLLALMVIIPSCALDGPMGIEQDPKTGVVTIKDPKGGIVGQIATGAKDVGGALPAPIGTILWGIGSILSLGVHAYQQTRVGSWKGAALATAAGVQDAIGKLDAPHGQAPAAPSVAADLIKAAVDAAHDAHDVPQAIQNILTPVT